MRVGLAVVVALVSSGIVPAGDSVTPAIAAYRIMNLAVKDVLGGTALTAKVLPGPDKQLVCVTTYFTGSRDESDAVNVRLDVFRLDGDRPGSLYTRDLGSENGGYVGRGELELVDLDGDGINEIVVTYDNLKDRLIEERRGEVIIHEPSGFRTAWSGSMTYDATRAARGVPDERRDRFVRELDVSGTLRTRGAMLVMTKKMIAVAGERLPQPKSLEEAFPLRAESGG